MESKDWIRYSRQLNLPDFGEAGQRKLTKAKVLVIGAGGLGAPVLQYLTAAGVGTMGVVDHDQVELSNLHRQVIFKESDLGKNKAMAAIETLQQHNQQVQFTCYPLKISSENALDIIQPFDIVVDGSDNFPTRYLLNDACVLLNKTLVYGSVYRHEGQVTVFNQWQNDGTRGPNYRDLFPTPPPPYTVPNCADGGVLGVLPGIIGCLQANEVLKLIVDSGQTLSGKLLLFESTQMSFRKIKIEKLVDNPLTGLHPSITKLQDYEAFCGLNQVNDLELSWVELKKLKAENYPFQLIDVRRAFEYEAGNIGDINIPLDELENQLASLNRSDKIILVCRSGARSARAAQLLKSHQFTDVLSLKGGLLNWKTKADGQLNVV